MSDVVNPALSGSNCELTPYVITSVNQDAGKAMDEARHQIAFYYTTRLYHSVLEPHGWQPIGEEIAAAFRKGDYAAMSNAVPDEMVEAIALTGTPDEVKDKIKNWEGLAEHLLFYSPSIGMKKDRITENVEMIIDTFGDK
jgi:alkanesulfonate monooxygenase SsuD/methylene tetrahydromethanopterin reductase-like flavin-dependent oxidoreductase (luciferase family)